MVTSVCDLGPVQSKSGDQSVNTIDETLYQKREWWGEGVLHCSEKTKSNILISLQLINAKQHSEVFHFAILASLNRYKLLIVEFKFALVTRRGPGVVTCGLRTPWLAAAVSQERDREPEPSDDLIIIIMADCYWDIRGRRKVIGVSKTLHFSDKNKKQSSKQTKTIVWLQTSYHTNIRK